VQRPSGPVVTSDSSLTYLSCYFKVRENIAMNSQFSIREVAVFPVMKMERHVCLFCLRFVSPFPSHLLFTTKEVACRFHTPDGENIVERPPFCGCTIPVSCVFGNEMFEECVFCFRLVCLSVSLSHETTREPLNRFS